jgi:NAD(P)H-hydrate epimerase
MGINEQTVSSLPTVTAEEMAAVDRAIVEHCGLELLQVMETAGRQVAIFARAHMLGGNVLGRRITILAGSGGNGGDALVSARYLQGWGAELDVILARELDPEAHPLAYHQAEAARRCGIPIRVADEWTVLRDADLIIDGLLGFSTRRAPEGITAQFINAANAHPALILAIDIPSGLQATTGEAFSPTMRARATLTLGLPKAGLLAPGAAEATGVIWAADIGIPEAAYRAIGREIGPIFARDEFIQLAQL